MSLNSERICVSAGEHADMIVKDSTSKEDSRGKLLEERQRLRSMRKVAGHQSSCPLETIEFGHCSSDVHHLRQLGAPLEVRHHHREILPAVSQRVRVEAILPANPAKHTDEKDCRPIQLKLESTSPEGIQIDR